MHWTPLAGAKFKDIFGPSGTPPRNNSRNRRRRSDSRTTSRLQVESLESRLTPAITANIVAASLASATPPNVTIGEIVRMRVVVPEPLSGNFDPTAFNVKGTLPSGLNYLAGTADMALVSQNGIVSTLDPTNSGGLSVTGVPVTSVTPTFLLPPTAITTDPATGAVFFNTGISHANDDGTVTDYVVIEFNALVGNVATNIAAPPTQLTSTFMVFIGGNTCNCTGTDTLNVVEPSITNLVKSAQVAADGNSATYTLTFSNTGDSTAYDAHAVDILPAGLTLVPNSVQVTGGTGLTNFSTAQNLDLMFASIAPGASVTVTYTASIPAADQNGQSITNTVNLDYTSLPGPNGTSPNPTGSVTPGASGSSTGERNGQDGVHGLNDYLDTASATITVQTPQLNSLSGFVFGDTNENGFYNLGDALLSGVPIALVNEATGQTVATRVTDANGAFSFTGLPDGTYAVLETMQPNGYNDGIDFPGSAGGVADPVPGDAIRHVTLSGGVNAINYEFGECPCPPAQLSGFVYEDFTRGVPNAPTNNDGLFEMNVEHAIAGVTVTLENLDGSAVTDFNGNPVGPVVTDANGFYQFTNLHAHVSYMVVETQPAGYADGKDTPGTTGGNVGPNQGIGTDFITNIPLDAGANSQMNNFGELPLPTPQTSINGFVYLDVNQNCIKDPNEPGLAGVTVQLTDVNGNPVRDINGNVVGNVQTDANGFYQFLNLPAGDYRVTELPPQPFFQGQLTLQGCNVAGTVNGITRGVAPMGSDVITGVDLNGGENSVNNDFGELLPSNVSGITLSGNVYYDVNKDNRLDAGDSPIGGARLHLFRLGQPGGPVEVAQTTTNEKGQYLFEIDTPGTYAVFSDKVAGFIQESDQVGTANGQRRGLADLIDDLTDITLADGDSGINYNFALITTAPPLSKQQLLSNVPGGAVTSPGVGGIQAFATDPSFANIDRNSMETHYVAVGASAGGGPEVKVYNFTTGAKVLDFFAYNSTFSGGARVAVGDINGDGTPDIITAPGAGGGPDIRVFDGKTGALIREFMAYNPTFAGGVFVAVGDVNGDGTPDIITGAGAGGGPNVRVFDGKTGAILADFMAYGATFTGGVSVTAGDFNSDGRADIVTGAGAGGGPHVIIFNSAAFGAVGTAPGIIRQFFAFDASYTGGVNVAANSDGQGDVTGDGRTDLVVGTASGVGRVRVFDGATFAIADDFTPYDSTLTTMGVHVSVFDLNGDGKADVVAGSGGGEGAFVRVVNAATDQDLDFWQAFNPAFLGGVWVASA